MTAPVDAAIAAFKARLGALLVAGGFLADALDLLEEPDEPFELDGDKDVAGVRVKCSLFHLSLTTHRVFLGGAAPRYILDQAVQVAAVAASGEESERNAALAKALDACGAITAETETLSGAVERVFAGDDSPQREAIGPARVGLVVTIVMRFSAADALGRS